MILKGIEAGFGFFIGWMLFSLCMGALAALCKWIGRKADPLGSALRDLGDAVSKRGDK